MQEFKDVASSDKNTTLTPGGVGQLSGSRLKFDETDALQGIFFVAANGTEYKAATLVRHKPAELIFMVPAGLPKGAYSVEVRTIFSGNKEMRTGLLPDTLTVG